MKLNFDKIGNKSRIIFAALVIFAMVVGVSCISATDSNQSIGIDDSNIDDGAVVDEISQETSDSGAIVDGNNDFTMTVRYNAGTGYHWEISPETYGVDVNSIDYKVDNPHVVGSSGTAYFNFHVNSDDYYVKLVLISPSGDIVDEVDSNMIN